MNTEENQQIENFHELVFEGHNLLLKNEIDLASEHYKKVMHEYSFLSENVKNRFYDSAVNLRNAIIKQKGQPNYQTPVCNGVAIHDVKHLIYLLHNIDHFTWECTLHHDPTQFQQLLSKELNEPRLAQLVQGLTDKEVIKNMLFRETLINQFTKE